MMRSKIRMTVLAVLLTVGVLLPQAIISSPAEAHSKSRRTSVSKMHKAKRHVHRKHKRRARGTRKTAPANLSATQQESIRIIRAIWPDDSEERAIRVARCESNLIPTAKNPRSSATGLFQMMVSIHGNRAKAQGNWPLTDAEKNTRAALDLYKRSGWRPWVCRG